MKNLKLKACVLTAAVLTAGSANLYAGKSSGVTGNLEMLAPESLSTAEAQYGTEIYPIYYTNSVTFGVSVEGRMANNSRLYVTVICRQDDVIVYQASNWTDYTFTMKDLAGQGLEWDGTPADCSATLVYRVEKGKQAVLTYLDTTPFAVN